jgi:Ras-related protein Rab-2A
MSNEDNYDYLLKYIIIGESGVGKSNILLQYVYNKFFSEYLATIGVEFADKNIKIGERLFRIQIWDTAGQECYKSITRGYYNNSVCALVVYDISSKDTFKKVSSWIEDCKVHAPKTINLILIGNKSDLEKREVTYEEGQELANNNGIKFYEASAKTGQNIEEIFSDSVNEIAKNLEEGRYDLESQDCGIRQGVVSRNSNIEQINSELKNKGKKGCC